MSAREAGRPWRVLVIDDEPIMAAAHADFVARVPGFECVAVAGSGQEGLRELDAQSAAGTPVDLVLLDMNLPDLHGLDVARRIRGRGSTVDIIAITAVRDLAVVRTAVSAGITQYLIKPFTFAMFAAKLEGFDRFHSSLTAGAATQDSIDSAFAALRPQTSAALPKGLIRETLEQIADLLQSDAAAGRGSRSATEVAEALDMSRVTARRYLEHLSASGQAGRRPRHGTRGRPEFEYAWAAAD
ncbi:response regulator [Zhihengliuella sp.]|uniref:response regulator n=1 Tax=Zhihengliuella sp. TaxID=1954483 RepID=UPI002812599D|nr:response regulator [Zhihengliuella sp.]